MRALRPVPPRVGNWLDDFFESVTEYAQSGSNVAGDLSRLWLSTGMSIEAVRNALNTIATTAGQDPAIVDAVADELRWLNNGGGGYYRNDSSSWIVPALIAAGVVWFITSNSDSSR